jgi:Holliday junction DNA helicase RuvA
MIASLRGAVLHKSLDRVILECGGVGYEVQVTAATASRLPGPGSEALLYIAESFGMYGGGATFYGFILPSEKALFDTFKEHVPGTGAKKSLEYLDRASKSLPDFRRAILDKDAKILAGVFGFTKKTADKLIESLKDKLEAVSIPGAEKIARADGAELGSGALGQALSALGALGYKPAEARAVLQTIAEEKGGTALAVEQIVRLALKRL